MATFGTGQVGNVNVPKKAIEAQSVIYEASTHMSILGACGIPLIETDKTEIVEDVVIGQAGKDRIDVNGGVEKTRLDYKQMRTDMIFSKYEYQILNSALLNARDIPALWNNAIQSASEEFAALKDYRLLTALRSSEMSSAAAGAVWGTAGADPEDDILTAISNIMGNSNMKFGDDIIVVVPGKVYFELQKLTLINNIQRTVKDYLEGSFKVKIIPYKPPTNASLTAYYDGLSTSALVFISGPQTATLFQYKAPANGMKMVETYREAGRGDGVIQMIGTAALVKFDGRSTYTSSTNYKTRRVYEITSVSS
jgi:hypothetical protein